jgi:hypothetical protein
MDELRKSRLLSIEGLFSAIEKRLLFIESLDTLVYKRRRHGGLTELLINIQDVSYLIHLGEQYNYKMNKEIERLEVLHISAIKSVELNFARVKELLQNEFRDAVEYYFPATWVSAIKAGLTGEFWYALNNRDYIQAHMNAPELLHPKLMPDSELVKLVHKSDVILRRKGFELWKVEPATTAPPEDREWYHPRTHWWWWLDQKE